MCVTKKRRTEDNGQSTPDDNEAATSSQIKSAQVTSTKNAVGDSMKVAKSNVKGKQVVEKWVGRALSMGVPNLISEFRSLSKWIPDGMTTNSFNENKDKNRYQDVPCQDKGRVVLKFPGTPNDYIHANYLATPSNPQRFICAQGPLDNTQHAFWAMTIQENAENIIMLCNCIEMTKIKCSQYWPAAIGEKMTFGEAPNQIVVTNMGMKKMAADEPGINVTTIKMDYSVNGAPTSKQIRHFQWENWPDRGVPMTKFTATNLLSAVRGSKFPIIVHCSAGIGRTGTIVALAYVQEKMQAGNDCMDMNELLKELRQQRPYSIQNEFQYLYLHRVLLAYFLEKYSDRFQHCLEGEGAVKYQKWCEDYKAATGGD